MYALLFVFVTIHRMEGTVLIDLPQQVSCPVKRYKVVVDACLNVGFANV